MEFFRLLHKSEGFSVAFGVGRAELSLHTLSCVMTFFYCDHGDRHIVQIRYASDYSAVVCEAAVSVQFKEVVEDAFDKINACASAGTSCFSDYFISFTAHACSPPQCILRSIATSER